MDKKKPAKKEIEMAKIDPEEVQLTLKDEDDLSDGEDSENPMNEPTKKEPDQQQLLLEDKAKARRRNEMIA